jgi:hypothetical protein
VPTGSAVRWYVYPTSASRGAPVATGVSATLPGGRPTGAYAVELEVTDSDGATATRSGIFYVDPDPANLPPEVTITSPANGETKAYDFTPVRFDLAATASDSEDGTIPFTEIDWTVSVNGGAPQVLVVQSQQFCFDPPIGPPSCGPIQYYVELEPALGAPNTQFDIKATVEDSGNPTGRPQSDTDQVTVFITQLI